MKYLNLVAATVAVCANLSLAAGERPKTMSISAKHPLTFPSLTGQGWQDGDETPQSVVKLNVSQLGLRNISFQYEYAFHKHLSGAMGMNVFLKRPSPGFFTKEDPTGEGLRNTQIKGFSITPELRYYPMANDEHRAPQGFYLAAYYRYSKYTYTSGYVENFTNGKTYSYDLLATYKGGTCGAMIGYQWLIGKHFSIDWWIIGGGIGKANFSMEATGKGFVMSSSEQAEVKTSVEQQLGNVPDVVNLDSKVSTTSSSVKATASGLSMLSPRGFGLCLGFSF